MKNEERRPQQSDIHHADTLCLLGEAASHINEILTLVNYGPATTKRRETPGLEDDLKEIGARLHEMCTNGTFITPKEVTEKIVSAACTAWNERRRKRKHLRSMERGAEHVAKEIEFIGLVLSKIDKYVSRGKFDMLHRVMCRCLSIHNAGTNLMLSTQKKLAA